MCSSMQTCQECHFCTYEDVIPDLYFAYLNWVVYPGGLYAGPNGKDILRNLYHFPQLSVWYSNYILH